MHYYCTTVLILPWLVWVMSIFQGESETVSFWRFVVTVESSSSSSSSSSWLSLSSSLLLLLLLLLLMMDDDALKGKFCDMYAQARGNSGGHSVRLYII